jgi:hypothetical protein
MLKDISIHGRASLLAFGTFNYIAVVDPACLMAVAPRSFDTIEADLLSARAVPPRSSEVNVS